MIGELDIGGVFVPDLLLVAVLAFGLFACARSAFRTLGLYRFVWHAGLFDVALFVVFFWLIAMATAGLTPYGFKGT
jgi:protein AaeX